MVKELKFITLPANEDTEDILYSKIEETIFSFKRHKISVVGKIMIEMIQDGGEYLVPAVDELCRKTWREGRFSEAYG